MTKEELAGIQRNVEEILKLRTKLELITEIEKKL
jgi:hypothetical protein